MLDQQSKSSLRECNPYQWMLHFHNKGNTTSRSCCHRILNHGSHQPFWLLAASSKGALTPVQDGIFYGELNGSGLINSLTTGNLGTPGSPLAVDGSDIAFGCQDRICKATYSTGSVSFISSESVSNISRAQWLTINKKKGLLTGSDRGLIWLSP